MALLLIVLITKNAKLKKRCFILAMVFLFIFSSPIILGRIASLWNVPSGPLQKNKTYSCVIVLGGFSGEDLAGNGTFGPASARFIEGVLLKTSGVASHILITSGNADLIPDKFTEGGWAKTQLEKLPLPDSSILIEQRSRNTIENAVYSKVLLQSRHLPPPYILITSTFHMRRAYYIFKKAGLDVIPYNSESTVTISRPDIADFLPDANSLYGWNTYLKEFVGYTVAHIKKF